MVKGYESILKLPIKNGTRLIRTLCRFDRDGLLGYPVRKVGWWPVASVVAVSGLQDVAVVFDAAHLDDLDEDAPPAANKSVIVTPANPMRGVWGGITWGS